MNIATRLGIVLLIIGLVGVDFSTPGRAFAQPEFLVAFIVGMVLFVFGNLISFP